MKEEVFSDTDVSIWRLPVGQMRANCYLLIDTSTKEVLIIDPGDDAQYIIETITTMGLTPMKIVATHGHFDHIMAAFELQQTLKIPFLLHEADRFLVSRMHETAEHFLGCSIVEPPPSVDNTIDADQVIDLGPAKIKVHHTPGHTPGSVCLEVEGKNILFTGDTIFAQGGVGRTDFSYSDPDAMKHSLARILALAGDMILLPGHGEDTLVAKEKGVH